MRHVVVLVAVAGVLAGEAWAQKPEAVALKRRGDSLLHSSPGQAEAAYGKAIALDPDYLEAYNVLSAHYLRGQKFAQAVTLLRGALKRSPRYAEGWYNMAYAMRKLGQLDGAIEAYRRFATLRPQSADPHYGLGLALQAKGDRRGAAASFRRYAQLEKTPGKKAWVDQALRQAAQLESHPTADKPVEKPDAMRPVRLAKAENPVRADKPVKAEKPVKADKPVKAEKRLKVAKRPPPDESAVVDPYARRAQKKPAVEKKPIVEKPVAKPAAADRDGTISPEAGKSAPTADVRTPQRLAAQELKRQGDQLAHVSRLAEAAEKYRKAIATDYSYTAAYNELGNTLFNLRRYADAVQTFRIAIRDNPDYHLGWYNLAYALRKASRNLEAIAAYRKFIQLQPGDPDPHYGLGLAHRALGNKADAVKAFRAYIRLEKRPAQERWVHKAMVEVAQLEGRPAPAKYVAGTIFVGSAAATETTAEAPAKPKTRGELAREAKLKAAEARKAAAEAKRRQADEKSAAARAARQAQAEAAKAAAEEKRAAALAARLAKADAAKAAKLAKVDATAASSHDDDVKPSRTKAAPPEARPAAVAVFTPPKGVAPAADTIQSPPMPAAPSGVPDSSSGKLRVQADTLARTGNCSTAAPVYKQAIAIDPFDAAAFDGAAYCAFKLGAYSEGATQLSLGLRDNPAYAAGWLHLARLQRAAGQRERAVGSYRKLLQKRPADPDGLFELARTLRALKMTDQAVPAYQGYLRAEKRPGTDPMRVAAVLELKGLGGKIPSVGEAPAALAPAAPAAAPPSTDKPTLHADILMRTMGGSSAKGTPPAVAPAATEKPEKAKTKAQLAAEARARAADERRAQAEARRAAAEEKRRLAAEAKAQAAEARRAQAEARRAAAEEKRRLAADGKVKAASDRPSPGARRKELARLAADAAEDRRLARLSKGKGKGADAAAALASAVSNDIAEAAPPSTEGAHDVLKPAPDAARGLVAVADAQFAKRRFDVALGVYQQAARLDPSATEPLYKAAVAAVALRQMHLAADLFARVVQLDPGNATALLNLKMARAASQSGKPDTQYIDRATAQARASLEAGRYALAEQQLGKLIDHEVSAKLHLMRAEVRLGLRQAQKAVHDAGRALALDPTLLDAFRVMGDAHRQQKSNSKALYYYRLYVARSTAQDSGRARVEQAISELSKAE